MKKVLLIFGMGLLICVFLAGCAKSDAERIVGKWEYRGTSLYQEYVFEKDGTGSFQRTGIMTPQKFQYAMNEDGTFALTWNSGITDEVEYAFNEDHTVLTITFDNKTFDYENAK